MAVSSGFQAGRAAGSIAARIVLFDEDLRVKRHSKVFVAGRNA